MQLPRSLRQAIEQEALRRPLPSLTQAAGELSQKYRAQVSTGNQFITSEAHRLAYLTVRMPATFAAASAALTEVRRRAPDLRIESLLDLGAGTGTAAWAAAEVFDQAQQFTLLEQDNRLIQLGRSLAQTSAQPALRNADWQLANLRTLPALPSHDLVICSYSLGEIDEAAANKILQAAWQATRGALVIVEPGTTKGFELIRRARTALIAMGGFVIAPCPHQNECPMAGGNWCHFAARFERSSLHRRLKAGQLGYEDEKYSYVAFSKHPVAPARARILRHPLRHAGYAQLQLCAPDGLQSITITRRDKERWRQARKADWGEEWPL